MEAEKSLTEDWWLWGLTAVAVILGGAYYFYSGTEKTNDVTWLFEGVKKQSIREIAYTKNGQTRLRVKRAGKSWKFVQPDGVRMGKSSVNEWLGNLLDPKLIDRFKGKKNRGYGFEQSNEVITIRQGEKKHTLYVGGDDPMGSGFYVRYGKQAKGPVFVMESQFRETLIPTVKDLRRKQLFSAKPSDLRSIQFATSSGSVKYSRASSGWRMKRNGGDSQVLSDTDGRALSNGLQSLFSLSASMFYDTAVPDGLTPYQARLKLEIKGKGPVTLKLGGTKEGKRLVKRDGWPGVTTRMDPAGMFQDLPELPEEWPSSAGGSSRFQPSGKKRKLPPSIRKRMKQMKGDRSN
ncbi:MAG: DUF4340 domain-containing protein [bacterium]